MKISLYKMSIIVIILTLMHLNSCDTNQDSIEAIDDIYLSIPDTVFELFLIDLGIDSDSTINHKMLRADAELVNRLDLNYNGQFGEIGDLTGIEGFVNITFLSAVSQHLEEVDLSRNIHLDTLLLSGNLLSSIDISQNTQLLLLDMQMNYLHTINGLSSFQNLRELRLSYNDFEEIDIDNGALENLFMTNNRLNAISLSNAVNLKSILLASNQLASIDISECDLLETLILSDNKLSDINLQKNLNLEYLYISSNELTGLDVSYNESLVGLKVDRNPDLSCIRIRNNQEIPSLSISEHQQLSEVCE